MRDCGTMMASVFFVLVCLCLVTSQAATMVPQTTLGRCLGSLKRCQKEVLDIRRISSQPLAGVSPKGQHEGLRARDVARLLAPRGPVGGNRQKVAERQDRGAEFPDAVKTLLKSCKSAASQRLKARLKALNEKVKAQDLQLAEMRRQMKNAAAKRSNVWHRPSLKELKRTLSPRASLGEARSRGKVCTLYRHCKVLMKRPETKQCTTGDGVAKLLTREEARNTQMVKGTLHLKRKLMHMKQRLDDSNKQLTTCQKKTRTKTTATRQKTASSGSAVFKMMCVGKCKHPDLPCECRDEAPHPTGLGTKLTDAPNARLCRTGVDFGDSRARDQVCLMWKKIEKRDPLLFEKKIRKDFDLCPEGGTFKQKWFSLPTVHANMSQHDPKLDVNFGVKCTPKKTREGTVGVVNPKTYTFQRFDCGMNLAADAQFQLTQHLCLGTCLRPPQPFLQDGKVAVRDAPGGSCACNDGIQTARHEQMKLRYDTLQVFLFIMHGLGQLQHLLCSTAPPVGCRWCEMGYDPQQEKTWLSPRFALNRIGKFKLKEGDVLSREQAAEFTDTRTPPVVGLGNKGFVQNKKNAFAKCPSWFDAAKFYKPWVKRGLYTANEVSGPQCWDKCASFLPASSGCDLQAEEQAEELGDASSDDANFGRRRKGGIFGFKSKIKSTVKKMLLRIARSAFSAAPCIVKPLRDYMWKKRIIPLITEFSDGSLFRKSGILKAISKAVGRLKGMVVGKDSILPRLLPSIASCMMSTWGFVRARRALNPFFEPIDTYQAFCSRIDKLNPSSGLPRKYTEEEKKSPFWNKETWKYSQLTAITTAWSDVEPHGDGGCHGDDLCRDHKPENMQLLPVESANDTLPANHPCTEQKPCTAYEFMTWKKEKWLKGPKKRDQVFRIGSKTFTLFFLRAPKHWLQQNGVRDNSLYDMNWDTDRTAGHCYRFPWVECIQPFCATAMRNNLALVLHSNQMVGEPIPTKLDRHRQLYKRDPLYKLVDCKKETMLPLAERVKKCSKMKALRFKMTDAQKLESPGFWHNLTVPPQLEVATMEPPSCAAKAELSILVCNTCCCKAGLVSTQVTMQMIVGSQNRCGAWLSVGDWAMRMFVGMMRMYLSIEHFAPRCFSGASIDNPNGEGSKAQQQYCSTKPGGTGKHLLASCSGKAASSTESATEVQELGAAEEAGRRAGRRTVRRMKTRRGGLRASGSFSMGARVGFQGNHEELDE